MNFFKTFRGRLLIVLAVLLVATLSVQYYLNLRTEDENESLREMQGQTLVAGFALGISSMSSDDRLQEIVKPPNKPFFFDERLRRHIKDILVIDNNWQVWDSLEDEYLPSTDDDGSPQYRSLKDLKDLPPLQDAERLGEDRQFFPNASDDSSATAVTATEESEAHAIPIQTNQGRWYVMVLLTNDKSEAARRAARPLIYTLAVLSISTLITIFLVWRFTRPIANLSNAAREVAEGNLAVRVPDEKRADEMGQLASRFNEMTAELEKKREIEAQLRDAEKSAVVGRLGSAIAHEIRNPLNYINLTLDHLRAKFAPEVPDKRTAFEKMTAQLKSEVARINQQITDFLSYSRPPSVNLQPTDIHKVVKDSLRIVKAQAEDLHVRINLNEPPTLTPVMADAEFLRSVFNNLFINAVQAMEKTGGSLNVDVAQDENFVKIDIADTGGGIKEENLAKIFEPYFSTKETGTGLGLAIVQKVIDVHSGTIEVNSTVGEGTKFTVRLPIAKQ
jgi:signal transduction histidine kinase